MTFRQAPFPSVTERDSHVHGWGSVFDSLAACMATQGAAS